MDNRYLTSGKVARLVGVSKGTVLRAVQRGDLVPALKMPGGSLRFVPAAVDAYARTLGIELPPGAVRTAHPAMPRRGRYAARRAANAVEPVYTWRTFNEAQAHPAFPAGGERNPTGEAGLEGADALIANVLVLLAGSLHAGATGVSRESSGQWHVEQIHDRMGMGISEGATDDFAAAFGTTAAPTGLEVLVVEDVRQDARFPTLAGAPSGVSALVAAQLSDAGGRLTGSVFAAYPHVRSVTGDDINLLRLASAILGQFADISSSRQVRGGALSSLAGSRDGNQGSTDLAELAIWQLGASDETVLVNDRMSQLLGSAPNDLVSDSLMDQFDDNDREDAREHLDEARDGSTVRFEGSLKRKDGSPFTAAITVSPLFVGPGDYAGALVFVAPSAAHDGLME